MSEEYDNNFDWTPSFAYKTLFKELLFRGAIITGIFFVIYLSLEVLSCSLKIPSFGLYFNMAIGCMQGWINGRILVKGIINKTGLDRLPLIVSIYFWLIILFVVWLLIAGLITVTDGVGIGFAPAGALFSFIFATFKIIQDT